MDNYFVIWQRHSSDTHTYTRKNTIIHIQTRRRINNKSFCLASGQAESYVLEFLFLIIVYICGNNNNQRQQQRRRGHEQSLSCKNRKRNDKPILFHVKITFLSQLVQQFQCISWLRIQEIVSHCTAWWVHCFLINKMESIIWWNVVLESEKTNDSKSE